MRDHAKQEVGCYIYLQERGFTPEDQRAGHNLPADRYKELREITFAFNQGWKKAQEWEVSEAQRQGIAVQAMNGLLAAEPPSIGTGRTFEIAEYAFKMSDAMIGAAKMGTDLTCEHDVALRALGEDYKVTADCTKCDVSLPIDREACNWVAENHADETTNYKLIKALQCAINGADFPGTSLGEHFMGLCRDAGMDV